jgi:hypothetical protein
VRSAVIAGFAEFFAAFDDGEPAGTRALFLLFGLFNLVRGVSMLVQGIELRRIRTTLHPVLHDAHAA